MIKNRLLTKSRFKMAVECPTKLFYTGKGQEYKDAMVEDDFLAMLAEGGYQVGELAKYRYPSGVQINEKEHKLAALKTTTLLNQENVVIFEAAIQVKSFFIRIDILVKNGNQYELIEVKAKSYNSIAPEIEGARGGISSTMLPYIQDVAFQTWVLRQAIPNADIRSFLMMPDKSRKAPVAGVNQMFKISKNKGVEPRIPENTDIKQLAEQLLAKVSVDAYVANILSTDLQYPGGPLSFDLAANEWANAYQNDFKIAPVIGAHCRKCQFKALPTENLKSGFHECWMSAGLTDADFKKGTVLDLWNFRKKTALIDQGTYKLSQVMREDIGDFEDDAGLEGMTRMQRQWLQVNGIPKSHSHKGFYLDDALVRVEMSHWKYPLHLIDFETSTVALPFYVGMNPYEAVAFQFSHHIMERDGTVKHAGEFLCAEPGEFPNYKFVRSLKKELENDDGSVFMWSSHENTILSSILKQLADDPNKPEDAEELSHFIKTIIKGGDRSMIDLCRLAEKAFYHPDTKGSNSIKKVLPAILKTSEKLQRIYSQPVYGAPNGIKSINFAVTEGFTWLQITDGKIDDPYNMLKEYAQEMLPEVILDDEEGNLSIIAAGGGALTAYARLQFEDLDIQARERIKAALLRYCELDTLAMVMVLQGWQELIN